MRDKSSLIDSTCLIGRYNVLEININKCCQMSFTQSKNLIITIVKWYSIMQ